MREGKKQRKSPKVSTIEKRSCSKSEGPGFYFRKTEGETRFKHISQWYMENERARTKGVMASGRRAQFPSRSDCKVQSTGGTLF